MHKRLLLLTIQPQTVKALALRHLNCSSMIPTWKCSYTEKSVFSDNDAELTRPFLKELGVTVNKNKKTMQLVSVSKYSNVIIQAILSNVQKQATAPLTWYLCFLKPFCQMEAEILKRPMTFRGWDLLLFSDENTQTHPVTRRLKK